MQINEIKKIERMFVEKHISDIIYENPWNHVWKAIMCENLCVKIQKIMSENPGDHALPAPSDDAHLIR